MPSDSRHITSYTCSILTIALSCTETLFFSRWPWSGLSRSPKVKLIMPSDSRHITSYTCFIVTIALSRTETLFISRWPRSGLSRSPKVKLVMPFDSRHIISYTCSIVTIALSRTETLFFSRWPRSGLSRSPKVKLIMSFDSRHIIFLYVFYSNYSAISHGNPVFQQMTSIWPFKVASRIQFKIATLTHKILSTGTPSYLSSLLSHYKPTRQLRSSSSNLLVQPPSKTKFGSLAFHTAAPLIWNGLPADVRSSPSFQTFKKMLKTHYFRSPPT